MNWLWTARKKTDVVLQILRQTTIVADVARANDLSPGFVGKQGPDRIPTLQSRQPEQDGIQAGIKRNRNKDQENY